MIKYVSSEVPVNVNDPVSVVWVVECNVPSDWSMYRRFVQVRNASDLHVLGSTTGGIIGTIEGATVATSVGGYSATTDDGTYIISNVIAGRYDLTVSKPGYTSSTISDVVVDTGQTVISDFVLMMSSDAIACFVTYTNGNTTVVASVVAQSGNLSL